MCWIAYNIEELNPKIAEDNIPVEKLVKITGKDTCRSVYFAFPYKINNIYKKRIKKSSRAIINGIHSYKGCKFVIKDGIVSIYSRNPVRKLDSWTKNNWFYHNMNIGIMSCIIPKGSIYYENERGEVVSSTIKPIYCYKIK